jgi:Na+-driven multidrug efflux pump
MGWFSEQPLAAHLAILQVNELIVVFILGFNEYCAIHVSSNISTATSQSLRAFLVKITATSFGFITLLLVMMYVVRFEIYALFLGPVTEKTRPIYGYMDEFLSFSFPFLLVDAFLLLLTGILRGCEITRWPLALNLIGFWVFGFLSQLLLIKGYPATPMVVWVGMQIGFLATTIGLAAYFFRCTASFGRSLRVA